MLPAAYAQMFPHRVGRCIADGNEFVLDSRTPWEWHLSSLHNTTAAFEEGLIGECIVAGPERCALAETGLTAQRLSKRMHDLLDSVHLRPVPGYSAKLGPGIVTYDLAIGWLFQALYNPPMWPKVARALLELEQGNGTLVLTQIGSSWDRKPSPRASSAELTAMVVCVSRGEMEQVTRLILFRQGDAYDAERRDLDWWADFHHQTSNM